MFLSAVSVLVVAQSSSEIPEGLMNNSVHTYTYIYIYIYIYIYVYIHIYIDIYIQGVTGGTDQTSGGCSLC